MSNRMRHYLPDNFIFGPRMLISGFVCAFKIEIKVFHSALNLHLDYRRSSSKNAQKHLKGNLSELLQKWDPDTHFWYPSWYSDAQSPGGTPWLEGDALESALYCSSDTPDPRQLAPESWSSTPGCVIRAFSWGLPSCPPSKDTFLSNDLSWGTCQMIVLAISSPSKMVFTRRWRHFLAPQRRTRFEVSCCPQLSSHVETRIQPTW